MPNIAIKKVTIQTSEVSSDTRDFGAEAQDVDVSLDSNGDIIEDINAIGVTVADVHSAAIVIKDINTDLNNKGDASALSLKADLLNGKIPMSELPDYVDDVIEGYYNTTDGKFYVDDQYTTEITGQTGKIYVDLNTNAMYRWSGNVFVEIINLSEMNIDDLSDVDINSVQGGQALVYDANGQKWINANAAMHIVQPPTVVVGTYTYNGTPQGPTITKSQDFDNYVTTTGATATNTGTYTVRFSLKNTQNDRWSDLTTADITYTYTIGKAAGSVTFDKNSVTLDDEHLTATVNVTATSSGNMSVSSSDINVCTASIFNGVVTITAKEETGNTTVVVSVAEDSNHNAASASIAVIASFVPMVSWDAGTDEQITQMVNAYYNGKITLAQIQQVWAVGQEREINLSAMTGGDITNTEVSGVTNTLTAEAHRAQTVKMVILDFDHDTLTTSTGNKTKALITLGQKDCLRDATVTDEQGASNTENGKMNNNATNSGGWKGCPRRTWCNNNYYNALPSYLKNLVKPVNKLSGTGGGSSSGTETTSDKCWLASEIEVFGTVSYSAAGEGTQYSYYTTTKNRRKLPKWNSSSDSSSWWERSPNESNTGRFCIVSNNGYANNYYATYAIGVAPSCCI